MWETALDFGYPVSREVAVRTPGVAEQIGPERWWRRPGARGVKLVLAVGFCLAAGFMSLLPSPWRYLVCGAFAVAACLAFVSIVAGPTLHSILAVYRWETWPAIVDVGGPDARGNTTVHFTLLRPDGRPHDGVRLDVRWPTQVVAGLRSNERVEVWFAGDLRFGGVVALPGGAHPVLAPTHGYPRIRGTLAENEVAARAGYRLLWIHDSTA